MRYVCDLCLFIIVSYLWINDIVASEKGSKNDSVFIPTKEWQVVEKGTPIPKGLHVRHNFQTGITEAKLMEPSEKEISDNDEMRKSVALHPDAENLKPSEINDGQIQHDDRTLKISGEELKTELKKIKSSKTPFARKPKRARFQSFDELKKEYENINFGPSTDVDLLGIFIEQFDTHRTAITSGSLDAKEIKDIMDILGQLEYLVHDIDNGLEFTRFGGLMKVIHPCLNGTIEEIKCEALHVLGAAVQSNPKVKEIALESEFVPIILRMLTKHGTSKLMDRCIYALGSLVRNYPAAQKALLSHGGLEIFSQVLADGPISAQKRIMNLVNDLIIERENLNEIEDLERRNLKVQEYTDVELEGKIVQHKLCSQLSSLLVKTIQNEVKIEFNAQDHDLLEAIYECVLTAGNICKLEFKQSEEEILAALHSISALYKSLGLKLRSDDDDLLRHLLRLVEKTKQTIFDKLHDEL
ncbi:nucleotide exchange factor Sil1 isoform X1 [Neodiprion pinetum]|uniref:nucleotide exchange factor Sil1 isoform X1 n=2 Tax=Neodiprion pinetum TaxID=441929 RepID=UPI001EDFC0FC|nr:nucleotide exchange factor Sil1 isoform X1 [Neodiprion pinetum]